MFSFIKKLFSKKVEEPVVSVSEFLMLSDEIPAQLPPEPVSDDTNPTWEVVHTFPVIPDDGQLDNMVLAEVVPPKVTKTVKPKKPKNP